MIFQAASIVLLNIAVYWRTLFYQYVSDDLDVVHKPGTEPAKGWIEYFSNHFFNRRFEPDQKSTILAHSITLAIHTIACLLVFFCFGANEVSWFAAVLFAVNPAHTQESIWISGKFYAIGAIGALYMWHFVLFVPLIYFLFTTLPVNILIMPFVFLGSKYWFWCAIPFVWFFYNTVVKDKLIKKEHRAQFGVNDISSKFMPANTEQRTLYLPEKLILFSKTVGYYLRISLFNSRPSMYHEYNYYFGVRPEDIREGYRIDGYFWVGVGYIFVTLSNMLFNYNQVVFGMFWWLVLITMWGNLITVQQFLAERYTYAADIGLMYAVSCSVYMIQDPVIRAVVMSGLFICYLIKLLDFMPAYKDNETFLLYSIHNRPNHPFAYSAIAGHYFINFKDAVGALYYLRKGLQLRPLDYKINFSLGVIMSVLNNYDRALEFLEVAQNNRYLGQEKQQLADIEHQRYIIKLKKERGAKTNVVFTNKQGL